ncbi:MAG: hypothetical protein IJ165_10615 [Proteobacteria bacterium]|nr:hypothetical protein [Pseudomonadota bacterium]
MSENCKRRLALACCAAMALGFASCSDDGAGSAGSKPQKCGDQVCTDTQKCVDNVCKALCGTDVCKDDQTCEEGVCKDKPEDPCAKCDSATQICEDGVCKAKPADDPCAKCTDKQVCEEGVCVDKPEDPCDKCTSGQVCDPDTKECVDIVEDPCLKCSDDEECVNFECVKKDPCANKTCPDGYRCDREKEGECVEIDPCETVVCLAEQTCVKARCVDDACLDNGVEMSCDPGQVCSKGECVDDGCVKSDGTPVLCDEGWECIKGICEETVCLDKFCEDGRSCRGGVCVDNECIDMTCEEGQICSKGSCTYEACLDKDPCVSGKACNAEGVCEFIKAPAISLDEPEDKTTDESGKTIALALHLNNAPTADVRVACEVVTESPNKEVEVACEDIVFNADNWQGEHTILVTGVEDFIKDGDQVYQIKVTTVSEDADFNGLETASVDLTNIDLTAPGFTFSATALTTYEDQQQEAATFTVSLNSKPSATVSLAAMSSNQEEGKVSPTTIRFTTDNWNQPQTLTVQGVDDDVRDGNINYTIFFSPSESNDEDYQGIQPKSIKVTNIDNDVAGLNVNIPAEEYEVVEGQANVIVVKLNTKPKQAVKVKASVDDATEASLDIKEIEIAPEEWSTGKEIRISGLRDYVIDGDQPIKISFEVVSEDEDYHFTDPIVYGGTVKDIDTAELVPSLGVSPIVKEGSSDLVTVSLSLSSKPTKDVNVAISVTDDTEIKINKKTMKFTPEHWDMSQDLLVSSVDDSIVDGDIKSKVVLKMTSADKNFNDVTKEIEFTTVDNDVAGFVVNSNAASFPENSGSTTTMTVALLAQPLADVKVTVASSDATELAVTSANTLTFTKDNWNNPQTVSVKVVDDNIADGTQTAWVNFTGSSTDANFNGVTAKSATYTIIDNDTASIVLTTDVVTVPQASPTATAGVRLGVQPSGNVTVTMATTDAKIMSFSKATLTFTTDNWDKPQNVTVTGNFNAIATASATATISASGTGGGYNNIVSNKIPLEFVKVPLVQDFDYTGKTQTVGLPKGKYKLEVWGAQGANHNGGLGGKGGYSTGVLTLANSATLYIQVAGKGNSYNGGYNGGGKSAHTDGAGGGGATHIAVKDGLLKNFSSTYKSEVFIIAGGGGGGAENGSSAGGYGGGTSGGTGGYKSCGIWGVGGTGGSQTAGGVLGSNRSDDSEGTDGSFGMGGTGSKVVNGGGGGGGGLYGGGGGEGGNRCNAAGGGGSGYLNASLANAETRNGGVSFPAPIGGTETGHTGDGHVRITLVQ